MWLYWLGIGAMMSFAFGLTLSQRSLFAWLSTLWRDTDYMLPLHVALPAFAVIGLPMAAISGWKRRVTKPSCHEV